MLADAAGEDEGAQAAEGGGEGAELFFGRVAEEIDGVGGTGVGGVSRAGGEEIAHVGAGFGDAEEAALRGDEFVGVSGGELQVVHEIDEQAGVHVARAGAHDQSGGGGEGHGGVDRFAVMDGGHAGAGAEVGEDDATVGFFRGDAGQLAQEKSVGEAVKAEAAQAGGLVAARDGEELGDAGHVAVEGGVEAGDLRGAGECVAEAFDQGDFAGKVSEIQRLGTAELGEEIGGDFLIIEQVHASVNDAMADGGEVRDGELIFQIGEDGLDGFGEGGGGDGMRLGF